MLVRDLSVDIEVPIAHYHSEMLSVSSSGLKLAYHSAENYAAYLNEDHTSKALDFGRAWHALMQGPEAFANEFVVGSKPGVNTLVGRCLEHLRNGEPVGCSDLSRTTKDFKALNESMPHFSTDILLEAHKIDDTWRIGATWINHDDYALAKRMCDAALNNAIVSLFLKSDSLIEATCRGTCATTGLPVRCRPDVWIPTDELIIDWKSIAGYNIPVSGYDDEARKFFRRHIIRYGYHISAAFYLAITGAKAFLLVFVSKDTQQVAVMPVPEDLLEVGREAVDVAMQRIRDYGDGEVDPQFPELIHLD